MSIGHANFSSRAKRLRTALKICFGAGALLLLGYLGFPKIFTGDYADIKIESIAATSDGKVTLRIAETISCGTPVFVQIFKDRKYAGGSRGEGRGTFPRRPSHEESAVTFDLNPERTPVAGRFEDSILFKRLLVRAGEFHPLRADQMLTLFDFRAADGARYSGFIRVHAALSAM